jgi:hypothetical protein
MTPGFQRFVEQDLAGIPIAAWAARDTSRAISFNSRCDWLPVSRVNQVFSRLLNSLEAFRSHQIEPKEILYTFERGCIYVAARQDGTCLALFVEGVQESHRDSVHPALDKFLRLGSQ